MLKSGVLSSKVRAFLFSITLISQAVGCSSTAIKSNLVTTRTFLESQSGRIYGSSDKHSSSLPATVQVNSDTTLYVILISTQESPGGGGGGKYRSISMPSLGNPLGGLYYNTGGSSPAVAGAPSVIRLELWTDSSKKLSLDFSKLRLQDTCKQNVTTPFKYTYYRGVPSRPFEKIYNIDWERRVQADESKILIDGLNGLELSFQMAWIPTHQYLLELGGISENGRALSTKSVKLYEGILENTAARRRLSTVACDGTQIEKDIKNLEHE